jgi:hypothetical protein
MDNHPYCTHDNMRKLEFSTINTAPLDWHSPTVCTGLTQLHCLNRTETSDTDNGIRNMFEDQINCSQAFVALQYSTEFGNTIWNGHYMEYFARL